VQLLPDAIIGTTAATTAAADVDTSSADDVFFDDQHKAELLDIDIALAQLTLGAVDDTDNITDDNTDDSNTDSSRSTAPAADAAI
jgi:hypothetical protein